MADDPPPLSPDLDAHLGRMAAQLDAEVRAEQAEYEAMAVQAGWRARSIVGVAREWMVHGDTVEVEAAEVRLTGLVIHTGQDFFTLETGLRGPVDVAVAPGPLLRLVESNTAAGSVPAKGPRTFVARLTEHEVGGAPTTLMLAEGGEHSGQVLAVASDHVLLGTPKGHRVVPMQRIALVWAGG